MVIAIVEEAEAVRDIDAIATTSGIDVLFIGTSDLSYSLGLRGRQQEPDLQEAIDTVVAAARRHGKFLGRPMRNPAEVEGFRKQGFQLFQTPSELGFFHAGAQSYLQAAGAKPLGGESKPLY
jgi:2-keto-3-deoxy-L-rhamnonate aldolase RhmA